MMRALILTGGFLLLFGAGASGAGAAVYFVSTEGDDAGPGTRANPFRTISRSVERMAPGDTAYVREGVYSEYVHFRRSGRKNGRISLLAYPGERPVIDGTGVEVPAWKALIFAGSSTPQAIEYITVDGFEIRCSSWYGIRVIKGSHWIVRNCTVHDTLKGGIVFHQSDDLLIRNNEVYRAGLSSGNGINIQGGSRVVIEYNYSHDNRDHYGVQIITDHPDGEVGFQYDNVVRYNRITRCRSGMYFRNNVNLKVYGNLIYHNVVDGHYAGIHLGEGDGTSGSFESNAQIFNNTIVGHVVSIYNQAFKGLEIRNNILANPSKKPYEMSSDAWSGHLFENNLYFGKDFAAKGERCLYADPLFENPAIDDYRLRSGSPAVDAGAPVSFVTGDCSGSSRPQGAALDIGALEFSSEEMRGDRALGKNPGLPAPKDSGVPDRPGCPGPTQETPSGTP
jgi:hypothetical protein